MRDEIEVQITREDLKFIVRDKFNKIEDLARSNSYCRQCNGKKKVEMIDYQLVLNNLNDIIFRGKCKSCGRKIARYVGIGENVTYRIRAEIIKVSKNNN